MSGAFRTRQALGAAVFLLLIGTGCSSLSPQYAGRKGLFDGAGASEGAHASRSRSSRGSPAPSKSEVSPRTISQYRSKVKLIWPLKQVEVTSVFGERKGDEHEGIDLRAKVGTRVYAAHAGTVLYASNKIGGYGKMVILKHSSGLTTVYAHHSKLLVSPGQTVKQGQLIGLSGASGRTRGPHLHFETRDGASPFDPIAVLPRTNSNRTLARSEQ